MEPNLLMSQITMGAALAYILRLLQKWEKTPWINAHTELVSAYVRAGLALIGTLGISYQWNAATHQLTISGLSAVVILTGLWHWFSTYAMSHGWGQLFNVGTVKAVDTPVEINDAKGQTIASSTK